MSAFTLLPPNLPLESQVAAKCLMEFLIDTVWPVTLGLKNKICILVKKDDVSDKFKSVKDVFSLCCSQIQKCMVNLLEIFQIEHRKKTTLQESRDHTTNCLLWCFKKLSLIEENVEEMLNSNLDSLNNSEQDYLDNSLLQTTKYFVNWIDHSLELLTSLSSLIYETEHKESMEMYELWLNKIMEGVSDLHTTIDELLISAMTLSRYCLTEDKNILTVRCQVVLREAKKLISEMIIGDVDKAYAVTNDSLRLPLKPTNIDVLINVLKDTIYILESNTNMAMLTLLVNCFLDTFRPLKRLEKHFEGAVKGVCACDIEEVDDCEIIKEFDMFNERLMQIGGFSISCSSDEHRVLSLKSSLASLESLDPQLVPSLMVTPDSHHSRFLVSTWCKEVTSIRSDVFLIVDPAAFTAKIKEMMNVTLLELMKRKAYVHGMMCDIINIGDILSAFFTTYKSREPEALSERERLETLILDLEKALKECKTVSNFCAISPEDFRYDIGNAERKNVTFEQIIKRLKLLFTIVNRINSLYEVNEDDGLFKDVNNENTKPDINTYTVDKGKRNKPNNISRTPFGRELSMMRHKPSKCIISKLANNFKGRDIKKELSFSVQLEDLFNDVSQFVGDKAPLSTQDKRSGSKMNISRVQNTSVLYKVPSGSRKDSLRKVMMRKRFGSKETCVENRTTEGIEFDVGNSVMDSTTQLQITEILDQLSNLSKMFEVENQNKMRPDTPTEKHVLKISVNKTFSPKRLWNIPVNSPNETKPSGEWCDFSLPSDVTTLERLNDIDLLETRINQLKKSDV